MKEFYKLSLKNLHTFGVNVYSKKIIEVESESDVFELIDLGVFNNDFFILGAGSNVLFLNIPSAIVRVNIKGIEIISENDEFVLVKAKAGEIWDNFVEFCVENNWGGLENLSLIPGTVGASPVQNIGAHGVEIKDCLWELKCINLDTKEIKVLRNNECEFSYRDSIFKKNKKEKLLITEVVFKLTKKNHAYNLSYGHLEQYFSDKEVSLKAIREFIVSQRMEKLPDPEKLGNAGSFFKNPIVDISILKELKQFDEHVPHFVFGENLYKVPAAWLIEKSGLKGYRLGNVGTYSKQPLVIVNYGDATSEEIYNFSEFIINTVYQKFNITLEREVNVI